MKSWGGWLIAAGVMLCAIAAFLLPMSVDTEVPSALGYGAGQINKVVNLANLHVREMTFTGGCALFLGGVVLFAAGMMIEKIDALAAVRTGVDEAMVSGNHVSPTASVAEQSYPEPEPLHEGSAATPLNIIAVALFALLVGALVLAFAVSTSKPTPKTAAANETNAEAMAARMEAEADNIEALADETDRRLKQEAR